MADEILRELWEIKDAIANEYANDLKAYVAHLQAKKHVSYQRIVDLRGTKENGENEQAGHR